MNHKGFVSLLAITTIGLTGIFGLAWPWSKAKSDTWKTYKNTQAGFWFKYPSDWKVQDGSGETKREVTITQPQGEANVLIVAHKDDSLRQEGMVIKAVEARKAFHESNKDLKIAKFAAKTEGKVTGYMMIGQQKLLGKNWRVEEKGLIGTTGRVLIMQSGAVADKYTQYKDTLNKIMDSFGVE